MAGFSDAISIALLLSFVLHLATSLAIILNLSCLNCKGAVYVSVSAHYWADTSHLFFKLCLQLFSHFQQSSLYFFRPRSSKKNAHSLFRYFSIQGIASTSCLLPTCRFVSETQKCQKPLRAVGFRGDFGRFLSIWAVFATTVIFFSVHSSCRCLSFPGNKKSAILLRRFCPARKLLILSFHYAFCFCLRQIF